MRPNGSNLFFSLMLACCVGCSSKVPYTGVGPHPQIIRGAPNVFFDTLANALSVFHKLLYFSKRLNSHYVSPNVEAYLVQYIDENQQAFFQDTKYRLNQYAPANDFKRLLQNKQVAWPYRLFLGFPTTLAFDILLPGRMVGAWNGDRYNPWTNTAHIYSNRADIALHKAAHALDMAKRKHKGTYSLLFLPVIRLIPERIANNETFDHLREVGDTEDEIESYQMLTSSWAGNIGKVFGFPGWIIGVLVGHVVGATQSITRKNELEKDTP